MLAAGFWMVILIQRMQGVCPSESVVTITNAVLASASMSYEQFYACDIVFI